MAENRLSSISQADPLTKMGEFWDTHDFTQFDTDAPDVEFTISSAVSIEPDLLAEMEKQARLRGVGVETLVKMWLQEKLAQQPQLAQRKSQQAKANRPSSGGAARRCGRAPRPSGGWRCGCGREANSRSVQLDVTTVGRSLLTR